MSQTSLLREELLRPQPAWKRALETVKGLVPEAPSQRAYIVLGVLLGGIAGVVAWIYYWTFESLLYLIWDLVPNKLDLDRLSKISTKPWLPGKTGIAGLYTVGVSTSLGGVVGLVQRYLGFPGDLPDTIRNVHVNNFIPIDQSPSMFFTSTFGISAGGSLGPEAPLVTLCGSAVSFVSMHILGLQGRALRNCTLMGMGAALAAFFGVALGGSLFALEVLHRSGLQFYEVIVPTAAAGTSCLLVFRGLLGKSFGSIWHFDEDLQALDYRLLLLGTLMGIVASMIAIFFIHQHRFLKRWFTKMGLDEHITPVRSGLVGGCLVGIIGVLLPPTMFWGEFEIGSLADPSMPLKHIWPKGGLWGLDVFVPPTGWPAWLYVLVGMAKLLAISVTVIAGFRGGFIFPLFFVGTSIGQAVEIGLKNLSPSFMAGIPSVVPCMTLACGLNSAITRTPFSSSLILAFLSGNGLLAAPCLCSGIVALAFTMHKPFIMSQQDRSDIIFKDVALTYGAPVADLNGVNDAMNCKDVNSSFSAKVNTRDDIEVNKDVDKV